jgi:uncharacterized glyoxalase superfamily protein PhnB
MTCIVPEVGYRDAREALAWLTQILGMEVGLVVDEPNGDVAHAELWFGGEAVYVGTHRDLGDITVSSTCLAAENDAEVEAIYARANGSGSRIEQELTDTAFGSHQFAVRDPEGNIWTVGTYRPQRGPG